MDGAGFESERLAIADEFAQLVRELDDAPGVTETAETAVKRAVSAIGATHAGLILGRPDNPTAV